MRRRGLSREALTVVCRASSLSTNKSPDGGGRARRSVITAFLGVRASAAHRASRPPGFPRQFPLYIFSKGNWRGTPGNPPSSAVVAYSACLPDCRKPRPVWPILWPAPAGAGEPSPAHGLPPVSVDLRLTAAASAQARTVAEAGTLNSAFRGASFLDGWHPDKSRRRLPDSEPAMLKSGLIERIAERNPHLYQRDVEDRQHDPGHHHS